MIQPKSIYKYKGAPLFGGHLYFTLQSKDQFSFPVLKVPLKNLIKLARRNLKECRVTGYEGWTLIQQNEILDRAKRSSETPIEMPALSLAVQSSFCFTGGFQVKMSNTLRKPDDLDALWPNRNSIVAVIKNSAPFLSLLEKLNAKMVPVQIAADQAELLQILCSGADFKQNLLARESAND